MDTKLRANSLSFLESIVMGIAGSAPGYTIAVTTATLIGTAGLMSPGALLIFAVPMLGIAIAYKALNQRMVNSGAAYEWASQIFGKVPGYFAGWALLIAAMVFMVTGSLPIATSTLDFFAPAMTSNVFVTTLVATFWFLLIGVVLIAGIKLTSRIQLVMTSIELVILGIIAIAAFVHVGLHGAVNKFSTAWFGFHYTASGFAETALVVIFFYWGWDVTANLSEETRDAARNAGNGGFGSVFVTISYYIAFTLAAMLLFTTKQSQGYSDNIVYNIAVAAGLGRAGGLFASIAVILSSIATLETTMLQFSRTLFAMGRDGALSRTFGEVDPRTETPVRAMYLLLVVGLVVLWASSLMPTVSTIINDSVDAISIQVAYYYGLAGLAAAWFLRGIYRESVGSWLLLCVFPAVSAIFLFAMALYSITTYNLITNAVGIGGLVLGVVFLRPRKTVAPSVADEAA